MHVNSILIVIGSIGLGNVLASSCWRNATCVGPAEAAFPGPWNGNNYAPPSRNIAPKSILSPDGGQVLGSYIRNRTLVLEESAPSSVLDFGIEVGGIISFEYELIGPEAATVGVAMSESKDFIGPGSDSSRGGSGGKPGDGPYLFNLTRAEHSYVLPIEKMRGGFRYLTLFLASADANVALEVVDVQVEISFQPTWENLRAYQGYFHSDDELLNKIWYSGAYTVQTNSAPGNSGQHALDAAQTGWQNDAFITNGGTVLLDGAKRDRLVWAGDLGTSVPSAFVSTGELESTKNAIEALYEHQRDDGMLPKAAPPYVVHDSDTYHLWAMIGVFNYFIYTSDEGFLHKVWAKYEGALQYALSLLNDDGIVSVQQEADWGRITYDKDRASASMLLYRVLSTATAIRHMVPALPVTYQGSTVDSLTLASDTLREAIYTHLWDDEMEAFKDSPDSDLHPQDANSMGLAFEVAEPGSREATLISNYLVSLWTPIGPECPELPQNVSPFISSIELVAHFKADRPAQALALMRNLWGWYLGNENGTQSTTPEGFLVDGGWHYRFNKGYSNGPGYMSHAHSWASGPTSSLTEYMLGLRVTKPAGEEWVLEPASFGLLASVQGGFSTKLGKFSAGFSVDETDRVVVVEWDTPVHTKGMIITPGQEGKSVEGGKGKLRIPIA